MSVGYHRVRKTGFTLIELMIVITIIGILAVIAIPKFADLIRKAEEGATRGNLGAVRSAMTIYYSDMEGQYPNFDCNPCAGPGSDVLGILTVSGKYMQAIPMLRLPYYHSDTTLCEGSSGFIGVDIIGNSAAIIDWVGSNGPPSWSIEVNSGDQDTTNLGIV